MKNITLITGGTLLLVNLIIGLLITAYPMFNLCFTSIVIAITTLLLYTLCKVNLKDGFIIGLSSLFSLLGLVELILGAVSGDSLQNNGCVITAVILIAIQVLTLVICNVVSKNV